MGFDAHFREFANFLDGVGLPAEWSPYFHGPDRDHEVTDTTVRMSREGTATPGARNSRTRPGTPFSSWLPSAPTGNRISETLPDTSESLSEARALSKVILADIVSKTRGLLTLIRNRTVYQTSSDIVSTAPLKHFGTFSIQTSSSHHATPYRAI